MAIDMNKVQLLRRHIAAARTFAKQLGDPDLEDGVETARVRFDMFCIEQDLPEELSEWGR